jgi:hypothetical protein
MLKMSHFWEDFYQDVLNRFNDINRDIIGELRRLHDGSSLETRAGSARGEGAFLHDCRSRDRLFGDIELGWIARVEYPALA